MTSGSMKLKCPRCKAVTVELIECESCKIIGCVKCITKRNKQWVCGNCKTGMQTTTAESSLSAMFG